MGPDKLLSPDDNTDNNRSNSEIVKRCPDEGRATDDLGGGTIPKIARRDGVGTDSSSPIPSSSDQIGLAADRSDCVRHQARNSIRGRERCKRSQRLDRPTARRAPVAYLVGVVGR